MALDDKRIGSKRIVEGSPVVLSDKSDDLIWMNPKSVLIRKDVNLFDKYLNGDLFGLLGGGDSGDGSLDGSDKDTVQLTDIESITYTKYFLANGELKYRAVLKIRNSSAFKENVIGVDARTANLEAQS